MDNNQEIKKLLEENIQASNRTTHAIRAVVRFLFIQLSYLTAAFLVWQIGLAFPDPDSCTLYGCEPYEFYGLVTFGLVFAGVIHSSRVGWRELESSDLPDSLSVRNENNGEGIRAKDSKTDSKASSSEKESKPRKSFSDWVKE